MPIRTRALRATVWFVPACVLVACAVGPDYRPRTGVELSVPEQFRVDAARPVDEAALREWWLGFDDPLLAEWIERAFASNLDVRAAEARLRAARAALRSSQAGFWPSLGASGGVNSTDVDDRPGGAVETWQAGFDAAWEIDLFGGTRRSVEAARADAAQVEATLQDVRSSIAAEVALNYIEARANLARVAVATGNLQFQDETLQITRWRHQAGLVSAQDVEQATVLRSQTAAAIPNLRANYVAAANRIATLIGEAPGGVQARLGTGADIPLAPEVVATGLPAELLRRRPDLVAAERALAAEVARIGVAESQLYPALRLGGSLSSTAVSAGDLGSVLTRSVGASLTAPLFQGGALRAQLEGQRASADAALARYEGVVLQALEDVDNALAAIASAREREAQLAVAQEASQRSVTLARTRYQSGLIDFQSLLEAERSLLTSDDSRLSARAARATAAVQLYKALGGGWPSDAPSTPRS